MTYEITPLQEAWGMLSDMHKDAYGFRPRGSYREDLTIEEIHEELDRLEVIIKRNMEEELLQEESNKAEFEALITRTIELGAGDRKTALRWLIEAEDQAWDVEFFVWKQGLGCGKVAQPYVDELMPIVQEIFADVE